ncbi:MAG: nuclear transport factor 2 family protein [Novosphingobium sp.]|nr:nuclear transport factor 2 family protein [Novosphingobium sp.]
MNRIVTLASLAALAVAAAGCQKTAPAAQDQPKLTDSEAAAIADKTQAEWAAMDVPRDEALYAHDVVAFDALDPKLSTDWANWDRLQQEFIKGKFDGVNVTNRKIQVLDPTTFVVSGEGTLTSKSGPTKSFPVRFTDVYEKTADGKWLIVNEHVSSTPPPPKAPAAPATKT